MQTVEMSLGSRSYRIVVEAGLLERAGPLVAAAIGACAALVVTDRTVGRLYLERFARSLSGAGFRVSAAEVPPGESSKCSEQLNRLYEACFQAGLERGSIIVALGGGVVGDLAGFAAASYLRGLRFVQAPTTLLAQVDSSVGGKTGINLPGGKNLVGAFHQPSLVVADVGALETLDAREFATGMAEVVKHAMIRDAALFERLESGGEELTHRRAEALEEIVAWNCRIKAEVVSADELESGLRAILNYGHTIGHAIEAASAYGSYTHGEAVALGMKAEAEVARARGYISEEVHGRQQALLERFGLPGRLRERLEAGALAAAMRHDKKVRAGRLRFVLPVGVGAVRVVDDVSEAEIGEALERLQP